MGSQHSTRFKDTIQVPHCATNKRENNLESLISKIEKRKKDDIDIYGVHETHLSDGSEGELHTPNVVCEKNPGHTKFIPVDKFTLKHLPEGQCDYYLYDYINAVADLTVMVNVYTTSPYRPEFWPKTNKPYPFYNMRGQEGLKTGSGMIYQVYKYINGVRRDGGKALTNFTKWYSDSPSNVWWEFHLCTATHVVFDDIEASRTTLKLFYHNKDSSVVIVDKVSVIGVKINSDMCWLICATCDKTLGDKLEKMCEHYKDIRGKVYKQYPNSKSADKLTFIVSHPHGCTKQVSIGQWIKKYKVNKNKTKFTYTTCTCPGSSGAMVHCVGYRGWWWYWYNGLVHSGTNSEHNYSAFR